MADDPKSLSKKHQTFVDKYIELFNATKAYLHVYPKSTYDAARSSAADLLAKPNIQAAIQERLAEVKMGADEVLIRLADQARADIGDLMSIGPLGFTLDMQHAREMGLTKLIKKVKQTTVTRIAKKPSDDDEERTTIEIELHDAQAALKLIGTHHKLFNEKVEHAHTLTVEGLGNMLDMIYGSRNDKG